MRLIRDVGIVIRQEWRWFITLTLLWVVLFALGPCRRSADSVTVHDAAPTTTASLAAGTVSGAGLLL
jgi:hypothetical protein